MKIHSLMVNNSGSINRVECIFESKEAVALNIICFDPTDLDSVVTFGNSIFIGTGDDESSISIPSLSNEPEIIFEKRKNKIFVSFINVDSFASANVFDVKSLPPSMFEKKDRNHSKAFEQAKNLVAQSLYNGRFARFSKEEEIISKFPKFAYEYALNTLEMPFPDGENAISRDATYSVWYARNILNSRFYMGEATIRKNKDIWKEYSTHFQIEEESNLKMDTPFACVEYAITKKERFLPLSEEEKIISASAYHSTKYAMEVLDGRFELGENKIFTDAIYRKTYLNFLVFKKTKMETDPQRLYEHAAEKGKYFPGSLEEIYISKSVSASYDYAYHVLKGRFAIGETSIAKDSKLAFDYAEKVIKGKFLKGEEVIFGTQYEKAYKELVSKSFKDPKKLLEHAAENGRFGKNSKEEKILAESAETAYEYSYKVLGTRFNLAEGVISKSPKYAYLYARNILEAPFEMGEKAINSETKYRELYGEFKTRHYTGSGSSHAKELYAEALKRGKPYDKGSKEEIIISKSSNYSYSYSKNIIKGRFELGEKAIAGSPVFSCEYARDVLKGPFLLGEEAINANIAYKELYQKFLAELETEKVTDKQYSEKEIEISKDAQSSYVYASQNLRGRFELGEKVISKDPTFSFLYALHVLKVRFEIGEETIAHSAEYSYYYARDVLKGRFLLGEEAINANLAYKKPYQKFLAELETEINTAEKAYYFAIKNNVRFGQNSKEIKLICSDPCFAHRYAASVLKGEFHLGEPIIAQSAKYSYFYAYQVLKSRFLLGEEAISEDGYYSYYYALEVLKGRFLNGEKAISNSNRKDLYLNLIKKWNKSNNTPVSTARKAYERSVEMGGIVFCEGSPESLAIAGDLHYSYLYAKDILKGRFAEGEASLSQNPEISYRYAKDILKGRFIRGEKVISESSSWSYFYALEVVKGRFELGEKAISENSHYGQEYQKFLKTVKKNNSKKTYEYARDKNIIFGEDSLEANIIAEDAESSYLYAKHVLKGEFKLGEKAISEDSYLSWVYAYLINSRFELGEKAISQNAEYSYRYAADVLGDMFELGEKAISKSSKYSYFYAKDVLKSRFEAGEEIIKSDRKYKKIYDNFLKNLDFHDQEEPELKTGT